MSEKDDQRAVTEWLAGRKGAGMKGTGELASRLHEQWPLGAVPVCELHQWVPKPDGHHHVCADCGLTVVHQSAS